jgi:hypothetical protein
MDTNEGFEPNGIPKFGTLTTFDVWKSEFGKRYVLSWWEQT